MAAARRGQSLRIDMPESGSQELPPIAAAFLIHFDNKAGYTIGWKRSNSGVELEGVVEFKSLPSGLHNVKEDLVYFIHEQYAGVSAFVNEPAAKSERNALMIAVGALVPLSYGRLGRSWLHAQHLKDLARQLVHDRTKTSALEDFWEKYRLRDDVPPLLTDSSVDSVASSQFKSSSSRKEPHTRNRSVSDATALEPPGPTLSPFHPALSLPDFLTAFGPLIFPLQRAALLRERILLIGQAPVELACNFVYNISILSNIPISATEILSTDALTSRLRPLFSIGVHDIPLLQQEAMVFHEQTRPPFISEEEVPRENNQGWVACTTDDVLAMKHDLYDVVVRLPPPYSSSAVEKVWPKMETSDGREFKATQRDLRRYRNLRRGLKHRHEQNSSDEEDQEEYNDESRLLPEDAVTVDEASSDGDKKPVEPTSWPALAYSSFMWWASAGEKRADLEEETERDSSLLVDFNDDDPAMLRRTRSQRQSMATERTMRLNPLAPEVALIAYFHRLTTLMLSVLADIVDSTDIEDTNEPEGEYDEVIVVSSEDMARMGLDVWSERDRIFTELLVEQYFGRRAHVHGGRVECCGVRIC
ncbi:MAG: hypothetical protein M1819_006268 [Sarea resinae]|nr:MAG: hypothetical protein M1819_006268 [Sarea resinae]